MPNIINAKDDFGPEYEEDRTQITASNIPAKQQYENWLKDQANQRLQQTAEVQKEAIKVVEEEAAKPEFSLGRIPGRFWQELKNAPTKYAASFRSQFESMPSYDFDAPKEKKDEIINFYRGQITPGERQEFGERFNTFRDQGMSDTDAYYRAWGETINAKIPYFKRAARGMKKIEEAKILQIAPEYQGESSGWLEDVAGALGGTLPDIGALILNPIAGGAAIFTHMQGAQFQEIEAVLKKSNPELSDQERSKIAKDVSMFGAAIGTPLEFLGNLVKIKSLIGTKGISRLLESALGEGFTELVQSYPEQIAVMYALNKDFADQDPEGFRSHVLDNLGKLTEQALYQGTVGAGAGVATTGPIQLTQASLKALIHPKQKEINDERAKIIDKTAKVEIPEIEKATVKEIIPLFDGANIKTLASDSRHFLTDLMAKYSPEDFNALTEFVGEDLGADPTAWKEGSHEKAAKAFEVYLIEGRAPNSRVRPAFEKMALWLTQIYKTMVSEIGQTTTTREEGKTIYGKFTKEIRDVFDKRISVEEAAPEVEEAIPGTEDMTAEQLRRFMKESTKIIEKTKSESERISGELDRVLGHVEQPLVEPSKRKQKTVTLDENNKLKEVYVKISDMGDQAELDPITGKLKYPVPELNINFNNIHTTKDIKDTMAAFAKMNEKLTREAKRGVIKHEETNKLAEALNIPEGQLAAKLIHRETGEAWNAEEVLAARQLMSRSAGRVLSLSKLYTNPALSEGKDQRLVELELIKAVNQHTAIQAQTQGLIAEAGRALSAMRIPVGAPEVKWDQVQELIDNMPAGRKRTKFMAKLLSAIADDPTLDLSNINKFINNVSKATTMDMVFEAWINGLLSGPQTHVVNALSNTLFGFWNVVERAWAGAISQIRRGISKIPGLLKVPFLRRFAGKGEVQVGEFVEQMFGVGQSWKEGLKIAGAYLRQEKQFTFSPEEVSQADIIEASKIETYGRSITADNIRRTSWGKVFNRITNPTMSTVVDNFFNALGFVLRTPGMGLQASDIFFKVMNYRMELNALAYRDANLKIRGGELVPKQKAEHINKIRQTPEAYAPKLEVAARETARVNTFTNKLDGSAGHIQKALSTNKALRLFVPFFRTPYNIFKATFERTPMALISAQIRSDVAVGGAKGDLALARLSLASGILATLVMMSDDAKEKDPMRKRVTGGGPTNPEMRNLLRNQGWQPYSILIGDEYIAYNRFEPLGSLLGLSADIRDIIGQAKDETEANELVLAAVQSISHNVTSKTYLRGVADLIHLLEDPLRYGEYWLRGELGTAHFFSTARSQIERTLDPEMEAMYGFMDEWKRRSLIYGFGSDMPARRNFWGDPIVLEGGVGPDIISPIYTSKKRMSAIDAELYRIDLPIYMPRTTQPFGPVSIELDPWEYDEFILTMNKFGGGLKQAMTELINTEKYKDPKVNDDDRAQYIKKIFYRARKFARQKMYENNPEIRRRVDLEIQNQNI